MDKGVAALLQSWEFPLNVSWEILPFDFVDLRKEVRLLLDSIPAERVTVLAEERSSYADENS